MMRFLVIRFLRGLLTLFLVLSFAFLILRSTGDPAMLIMSADAPPEALEAFRKGWGLDAPLWQQYLGYFKNLAQGNFGYSMRDKSPAMDLVLERIPATLSLALPAFALKLMMGISAGVYAALHRNTWIDRFLISLSIAGYTMPSFVLGLVLVLVFAVGLGWLPSGGDATWQHAILPVITLSLGGAAVLARFTRSAMLEVMGEDYIRNARAKGLSAFRVLGIHAMRNAMVPVVTVIGLQIGVLFTGAILTETIFSWPGVGKWLIEAIARRA